MAFTAQQEAQADIISITDKPTLNLKEADRLSGLSCGFLAAAIHDGKLNAASTVAAGTSNAVTLIPTLTNSNLAAFFLKR